MIELHDRGADLLPINKTSERKIVSLITEYDSLLHVNLVRVSSEPTIPSLRDNITKVKILI